MCVVSCDDIIWDEEEGGSGVSDGGDAFGYCIASADGVASAGKAPEALGIVDGGVGDVACVSARVDVAEVVAARFAFLQVGCEEGESRRVSALLKKVCCWSGVTVLMEEKARPRSPSLSSWANSELIV